jgi:hypothetical protein
MRYNVTKYILSISFSLFLYFTLMLSHKYIESPWDLIYEISIVFGAIFLLFWDRKLFILIACIIIGILFWLTDRYLAHPLDYIIHAMIFLGLLVVALIVRWNARKKSV